jgi:hypothetical protein
LELSESVWKAMARRVISSVLSNSFRDFFRLFVHLQVESGCLGTPVAPLTPFGYRHFFHGVAFSVRAGIEFIEISVVNAIEAVAGLVAWDDGLSSETGGRESGSRGVRESGSPGAGPFDFAPFRQADSSLRREDIFGRESGAGSWEAPPFFLKFHYKRSRRTSPGCNLAHGSKENEGAAAQVIVKNQNSVCIFL